MLSFSIYSGFSFYIWVIMFSEIFFDNSDDIYLFLPIHLKLYVQIKHYKYLFVFLTINYISCWITII